MRPEGKERLMFVRGSLAELARKALDFRGIYVG